MDFLKRNLAPVTEEAWEEILEQSTKIFQAELSARKFVDVEGPYGLELSAVPKGRLHIPDKNKKKDVSYGIHLIQPLIETRALFDLDIWELDNVSRGAEDIDLNNLEIAAGKIAAFEENAIYEGFKEGSIEGLRKRAEHKPLAFPEDPEEILNVVAEGIARLHHASVEGPYSLVVDTASWEAIISCSNGYPLKPQLEGMLGGSLILAKHLNGSILVSERGGDFRLTLGQDMSIGYESHTSKKVTLYFTESFTFEVLDPAAVILIQ